MFGRGPKPKKFDYTPRYYSDDKEGDSGRTKIRFKPLMTKKAGKTSLFRLILIFLAVIIAYIYIKYYFQ